MKHQVDRPSQYVKGWVEFYKLKFKVNEDVLIPRPETELLVDEVLRIVNSGQLTVDSKILDLGTGSGNIAVSLVRNNPNIKVTATEISEKALAMAKLNAKFHGVEDRIEFMVSDLLDRLDDSLVYHTNIDIIVTNLPYIPSARIDYLDSSVKDFEPHVALDGGEDGFGLYRKLFEQISKSFDWRSGSKKHPKYLFGEIDYTHGEIAVDEARKFFPDAEVAVKLDLAHKQRILHIKF